MEKLTRKHINPYIPYRLMVTCPKGYNFSGIKTDRQFLTVECAKEFYLMFEEFYAFHPIENFKPILRKMDLTKPIQVDGEEIIPFKELAKMYYAVNDSSIRFGDLRSNYLQVLINGEGFVNQVHRINLHFDTMRGCQLMWLFKHKFDVFNLIDRGLAIDVNTLENNPYE